ncbi:hypothetical protein CO989_09250 [Escherichia coli]|uniref:Rha family transcriptional regulator n=1 Tax=Escherichia coli TaxID=562 RepID=UPI000BBB77AE|nr:Rha family transcriptional regulator [Escherichia coli]EKF4266801.1 Rha family transcriptional regulator [Escherichia coli O113]EHL2715594.1 Rha family transcriptional regulator [Escherichia coli]EKF4500927.1 Rha family transcriptional regulator [Escherichia coli O113]PCG29766.1 hypothetical protein CO989_09250 [Escherichia coli]PCG50038.1 hypothetical protein CO991_09930 [Escherichia coli]
MNEVMPFNGANDEIMYSSRVIAERVGKEHFHVIRDIKKMLRDLGIDDIDIHNPNLDNLDFKGYSVKWKTYNGRFGIDEILLNKNLTMCLITGYDTFRRMCVIEYVEELEKQVNNQQQPNYGGAINNTLAFAETASRMLNLSNSSKLGMLQKIEKEYNIPPILPQYAIDAPIDAVDGSSRVTKSLTALLEEHNVGMTAREVNPILERHGIIERKSRRGSRGQVKYFWALTPYGLRFGKNVTAPNNQLETQPHYFESRFKELISIIFSD